MKILSLEAQNILRLKAVHIVPEGPLVIIGGENKQGKTSILKTIRMAFGGARELPPNPVHRGAKEGNARIDLGDLVVEFHVDGDGGQVVVRNADGKKQARPQDILNRLFAKVAFDPESFGRMAIDEPKKAVEVLKRLANLDFSSLDAERSKLYEKRTSVGSVRSDAEVRISQFPPACTTAPDEEVSISALVAEKTAADAHNHNLAQKLKAVQDANARVEKLQAELTEAESRLSSAGHDLAAAGSAMDTTAIVHRLSTAEDTNRLVRAKKDRAKAVATFTEKDREYAALTKKIADIDESKRQQLANAKWPVPGLGFTEEGVTIDGQPFEQASQAEARVVSFAIGAALNPELKVALIDDGEKLDKTSMKHLAKLAAEKDMQVWIERVGDGDAGAIIIEDGEIANYSDEV